MSTNILINLLFIVIRRCEVWFQFPMMMNEQGHILLLPFKST